MGKGLKNDGPKKVPHLAKKFDLAQKKQLANLVKSIPCLWDL